MARRLEPVATMSDERKYDQISGLPITLVKLASDGVNRKSGGRAMAWIGVFSAVMNIQ